MRRDILGFFPFIIQLRSIHVVFGMASSKRLLCSYARLVFHRQQCGLKGVQKYSGRVLNAVRQESDKSKEKGAATPPDLERAATHPDLEGADPLSHPDYFGVKEMTNIQELFEARVHLGHKMGVWNPIMKPYLYGTRADIHIFDLDQTLRHLRLALNVTGHIAYRNGIILFVNERSQFERLVQQTARDCGEYFVSQKWSGGTLTNSYKLLGTLRLPDLVVFLSVPPSKTGIKEVAMSNIPSIGIVDSDCNPNLIVYPVPGNDDTPSAVTLYCSLFGEVIRRAKQKREEESLKGSLDPRRTVSDGGVYLATDAAK